MAVHVLVATCAMAQINYGFSIGTNSNVEVEEFIDLQNGSRAGACQSSDVFPPSDDYIPIGFTFVFDGVEYEEVIVNSNGVLTFDEPLGAPGTNALKDSDVPLIAPFWDRMRLPGGGNGCDRPGIIRFGWSEGKSGRILVIEYYDASLGDGCSDGYYAPVQFQVRLYEGSNQIEFYYTSMDTEAPDCSEGGNASTTASIGLASENGFLSITPQDGSGGTSSTTVDNTSIDLQENPIDDEVTYLFCPARVQGNTKEGGTEKMQDGDVLLAEQVIQIYNSADYRPFTMSSPCASNFSYSISGPDAGDYTISPANGELDPEKGHTPTLTFRPTGLGTRVATLSVRDDRGFVVRSYGLAAEGVTRTVFVGDVSQGGTPELNDGDILMEDIRVRNGSSGDFTPIRINILPANDKGAPGALVQYTLDDPTGQFSIDRTVETVAPGTSSDSSDYVCTKRAH